MIPLPALSIGTWLRLGAAALLVALLAWGAWKVVDSIEQRGYRRAQAEFKAEREQLARQAIQDAEQVRTDYAQRVQAQQEVIHVQGKELARMRADRDAAAASSVRLRHRAEQLAAACRPREPDTAAAAAGPPADSPGDLLAYMLRRVDEAAGGVGAFADEAAAAGGACEGAYDALRLKR